MTGWWLSPDTSVSSINKTDRHDIPEILLKVVINTINQSINQFSNSLLVIFIVKQLFIT
jgi:hypothetical protein